MSSTQFTGATPLPRVIPFPPPTATRTDAWFDDLHHFDLAFGVVERVMDFVAGWLR